MSDVVGLMLRRFTVLYGEPKTPNREAYIAEYVAALKGYSEAALTEAATAVIQARTIPVWPSVGECVKAARAAADSIESRKPRRRDDADVYVPLPADERARVSAKLAPMIAKLRGMSGAGMPEPPVVRPMQRPEFEAMAARSRSGLLTQRSKDMSNDR